MAQIPKGRLVDGPYKPICRDCAIYFLITVHVFVFLRFFCSFSEMAETKSAGCTTGEILVQADRVRLETLRLGGTNLVWNLWQWFWCYFQHVLGTTSIWCLISKAFQNWWVILVLTLLWQDNLCLSDLISWKDWVKYIQEIDWHLGILTVNWDCRNSWLVNHPPPNVPPQK